MKVTKEKKSSGRVSTTYPSLSNSEKASRNSLIVSSVRSTEPLDMVEAGVVLVWY